VSWVQVRKEIISGDFYINDRPPRRFAPGRRCAEPECATRLSIYNESDYCSVHSVGVEPRRRGKRVI